MSSQLHASRRKTAVACLDAKHLFLFDNPCFHSDTEEDQEGNLWKRKPSWRSEELSNFYSQVDQITLNLIRGSKNHGHISKNIVSLRKDSSIASHTLVCPSNLPTNCYNIDNLSLSQFLLICHNPSFTIPSLSHLL